MLLTEFDFSQYEAHDDRNNAGWPEGRQDTDAGS